MTNQVYRALADPTRRRILQMLRKKEMSAGEIAAHFDVSKPTMSKHFAVLKAADLIRGAREGTTITYAINLSVLEEALMGLMSSFKISGGK